ncbi:MAG: FkbM family methyltransferase [Saprospiraceae bacterium]
MMKALISIWHLYRILGFRALGAWVMFRLKQKPRIWMPMIGQYIYLRSGTSDEWLLYQIFSKKQYHIKVEQCSTIVDLGANIGLSALYLGRLHPKARVVCVEPDADNFHILKENIGKSPQVICVNAAIGAVEGRADLAFDSKNEPWATRTILSEDGSVRVISMNQLIADYQIERVDILKIDIEGSELDMFSKNYEHWLSITNLIVIELHEHLAAGCGQQFFKALEHAFGPFSVSVKGANLVVRRRLELSSKVNGV